MIRMLMTTLCCGLVIAAAVWAYQENDATRASYSRLKTLEKSISDERERIAVLEVEWAYLNRPQRLRSLARLISDDLWLFPIADTRFGDIEQLSFRPPPVSAWHRNAIDFRRGGPV